MKIFIPKVEWHQNPMFEERKTQILLNMLNPMVTPKVALDPGHKPEFDTNMSLPELCKQVQMFSGVWEIQYSTKAS